MDLQTDAVLNVLGRVLQDQYSIEFCTIIIVMAFIPYDHVGLLLVKNESNDEDGNGNGEENCFYLDIPLTTIDYLCLTPRKYLLYLGWCILGLEAEYESLALGLADEDGEFLEIDNDGDLEGGGIYTLLLGDPLPNMAVVDLEVIKARTDVPSETTQTRNGFRDLLLQRDMGCIFTSGEATAGESLHIIPYRRGSDWFKLIIQNRPHDDDDDIEELNDINDVRNGFFANRAIHPFFDARQLAILKTPNRILEINDIPLCQDPLPLNDALEYPENSRCTAQWLCLPSVYMQRILPNHSDAAFMKNSVARKPSTLLLHYNYGAAAVKLWGCETHILADKAKQSRPRKPVPTPSGLFKNIHDRSVAIKKRAKALPAAKGAKITGTSKGKSAAAWDKDDVMLFLWGNSRAATERYLKKHEAKMESLEQWRQGVDR